MKNGPPANRSHQPQRISAGGRAARADGVGQVTTMAPTKAEAGSAAGCKGPTSQRAYSGEGGVDEGNEAAKATAAATTTEPASTAKAMKRLR